MLIVILIFFLLFFINNLVREMYFNMLSREMKRDLKLVESYYAAGTGENRRTDQLIAKNKIDRIAEITEMRITIIDYSGIVVYDSNVEDVSTLDNHRYRKEVNEAISVLYGESIRYSNTLKINMLYIAKKGEHFIFRAAKPLYEINNKLSNLKRTILLSGIIIIIISIIIIMVISKKISGPIREAVIFSQNFAMGDYSSRIMNYDDNEIGILQKSLNDMADIINEKINNLIIEQKKLKVTIESIQEGIAVIGNSGKILICNSAFGNMLNINTEPVDKIYYEIIWNSSLNEKIKYTLSTGKRITLEVALSGGNVYTAVINPFREEDNIRGILLVLHDITEQKKIDQIKTELIGNMSHELKTPVAILMGYLETMREHLNDKKMMENLIEKALANIERQNSLIDDILKLNKLEEDIRFLSETIDIEEILLNCIEILMPKCEKKNINIETAFIKADRNIQGNRFLAEEVFFNLVDNAINYNINKGSVFIRTVITDNSLIVKIKDTGIGIPADSIDRIFERFYRVDKSRSRQTGGTGLGLSIVKHAAELLGWSVNVLSNNSGTEFQVIIKIS